MVGFAALRYPAAVDMGLGKTLLIVCCESSDIRVCRYEEGALCGPVFVLPARSLYFSGSDINPFRAVVPIVGLGILPVST